MPENFWNFDKMPIFAHANANLQDGAIAQLVEQRTENPCVPSSILGGTTSKSSSYRNVAAFFVAFLNGFYDGLSRLFKPLFKP